MAEPFKEGTGWAYRIRKNGVEEYKAGFASKAAAQKAQAKRVQEIESLDKPKGRGPTSTSLGVALMDYGRERLPYLKGAAQEANRLNHYLRPLGLPVLKTKKLAVKHDDLKVKMREEKGARTVYCEVELVREGAPDALGGRKIPNGLHKHRAKLELQGAATQKKRAWLASRMVADITRYDLQELIDAMRDDSYSEATVHQERALLRSVFNHCRDGWNWTKPMRNPAAAIKLEKLKNERDRILLKKEWIRLAPELFAQENKLVLPLVCLMVETGMRSGEPLTQATWGDVDWENCILNLRDSKTGAREVPLGPGAIETLQWMQQELGALLKRQLRRKTGESIDPFGPDMPLFPTTYEAVKDVWKTTCRVCGIENLRLHDLRHTAATRYHRELNGDIDSVMVITGHQTYVSVRRYINQTATDVALRLHKRAVEEGDEPLGLNGSALSVALESYRVALQADQQDGDPVSADGSVRGLDEEAGGIGDMPGEAGATDESPQAPPLSGAKVIAVDFRRRTAA